MRRRAWSWVVVAFLVLVAVAVTAAPGVAKDKATKASGSITVSAAASLTEAFTKMGTDFQKANPGTTISFNFAASSALVSQIQGGAPADVFASADGTNMMKLVNGGQVTAEPTVFAANALTIVTKPGNPKKIKSLAGLAKVGTISLCADTVPCGRRDHGRDCQDPVVAQRVRDLPDRPARVVGERRSRRCVGEVHGLARGPEDAAELRVPPAARAVTHTGSLA